MSTAVEEQLVSLERVAGLLDISKRKVYRLIAGGELPRPIKIGRSARMFMSEITAYLTRRRLEGRQ